jgi:3-oxoadipate enol-lactonase
MPFWGPIHYRLDGDGASERAEVLVLSNSLGTDLGLWDAQVPAFAERFRVLRYDGRGHGGSEVTPGPYTVELLARDLLALLDGLALPRVHLCGLSLGGQVGLWLGLHAPERLGRLVVSNTGARIGTVDGWNARIEAVRRDGVDSMARGTMERWFTPAFRERSPVEVERLRRMLLATPAEGYIGACAAVRDLDLRDAVSGIGVPALVITGSADAATPPADSRALAAAIPGARYVELPAAHLSNIEAAEDFTAAVTKFLSE